MTHAKPNSVHPAVALQAQNVHENARVFAHRVDMLAALVPGHAGGIAAEVGVALGDFSKLILKYMQPSKLVAFDTFEMHKWPIAFGRPTKDVFGDEAHLDYYQRRFVNEPVSVEVGRSDQTMAAYADGYFDFIYVDAGHLYEDVKPDSLLAAKKVKPEGLLIFNDYVLVDVLNGYHYGVVQAVNELVTSSTWKVAGFALNSMMFCDIALRR